eukprot:scaffold13475_cov103-Cylindrotheca_fusiformis.AAC.1
MICPTSYSSLAVFNRTLFHTGRTDLRLPFLTVDGTHKEQLTSNLLIQFFFRGRSSPEGARRMAPQPKFAAEASGTKFLKHKRRYCRADGCTRIVKSQGLCQRHGAKPRKCKVEGCEKQAQGNFDRMCKSHFKAMKRATTPLPKVDNTISPPPPEGSSVYDHILPDSIQYTPDPNTVMPLIAHLKSGFDSLKPPAWHRNEERRARGLFPVDNPATQLEGWERELVWMEILVLTGASRASFRHLARAWGRDKGFHMVLAQFICERHGDVRRKRRQGERGENDEGEHQSKYKKMARKKQNSGMISADIWDDSCYGDADTNEALAADIFNFSAQEFENVSSKWKGAFADLSSASSPATGSMPSHGAMTTSNHGTRTHGEVSASPRFPRPPSKAMSVPSPAAAQQLLRYQQHQMAMAPHLATQTLPLQSHTLQIAEAQQHQGTHYGHQQMQPTSLLSTQEPHCQQLGTEYVQSQHKSKDEK